MTDTKDLRPRIPGQKKRGKHERADIEIKELRDAGIAPDETRSQDADRHHKVTHQKSDK